MGLEELVENGGVGKMEPVYHFLDGDVRVFEQVLGFQDDKRVNPIGRGAVYWLIFMTIGIYVACIVPAMFGFPQRGSFWNILLLLALFVTVCVLFSMTWTTLVTRRESAFLLFLFMSPICVFQTGFSWPTTAFPGFWMVFSWLFPSTFGCQAFINLNTAGASLEIVAPQLRALCLQGGVYYILACGAIYVENFVLKHRASFTKV